MSELSTLTRQQQSRRPVSVAPMMDWTDRHCRYFLRLISRHSLLYTEMLTTGALLHGDRGYLLDFHEHEKPLALQLGGSDPAALAVCARHAEQAGYDEINLNVGCPSDRVQSGRFGACLMLEPALVADCVAAMCRAVNLPVTVKTRLGVDDSDSYELLAGLVAQLQEAGAAAVIIHARKAWLQGLSPKQNREVPPLDYSRVYRLKEDFPDLAVYLNGGVTRLAQIEEHLRYVDGVMIGREAYHNPYLLAEVDRRFYGSAVPVPGRRTIVEQFMVYVETQLGRGVRLSQMTRHILGLFNGVPGARAWRRTLSEQAHRPGAGVEVIERALMQVAATGS